MTCHRFRRVRFALHVFHSEQQLQHRNRPHFEAAAGPLDKRQFVVMTRLRYIRETFETRHKSTDRLSRRTACLELQLEVTRAGGGVILEGGVVKNASGNIQHEYRLSGLVSVKCDVTNRLVYRVVILVLRSGRSTGGNDAAALNRTSGLC